MNVDDYRRDFAAYNSALELAHYEHRAGLQPDLHTEPVYDRYGHLFTRDAIGDLQKTLSETPSHRETERSGLHALFGAARIGYLESRARVLTEECARCESSARVKWDGQSIPVHGVLKLIANEPVTARRRELTARRNDALGSCADLRAARIESFHDSVRALGFDSYRTLFTDITGTDYERLAALTDNFLCRTESAYSSALALATARDLPGVGSGDLRLADYFFFQRMPRLDPFFPAAGALATYRLAMSGLGIRAEQQQNIHIDDEVRPLKYPRAACFRIDPPRDVRLLLAPIGGVHDYTVLFHEAGHAQHFGWTSRDLAARHPEFLYAPDYATTEGFAFLFNYLFLDATWLAEHRNGMSPGRARSIVRDLALLTTHNIRRYCAKLSYEIAMHDSPNVRAEQLAATYAALQEQATGFRHDPALHLWDVDDGFYAAAYLRAWAFEVGLREHLRTRYGRRWWAARKAGDELIDLWNTSSRYRVEELARLIGFGEIGFDQLADTLIAAMNED